MEHSAPNNVAKSQKESEIMLKLKKPNMLKVEAPKESKNSKEKTRKGSTLPPDTYKDEFDPLELVIDDSRKFVLSVKRGGDYGLPMCDVRQYQTTEVYTGFTKKGINFPVEFLPDLIELLQEIYEKCGEKNLLDEFSDDD